MKKTSERGKKNKLFFFFFNISGQQQRQENWVCFVDFLLRNNHDNKIKLIKTRIYFLF